MSQLHTHTAALLRRDPSGQVALRWRIDECAMAPAAAEQLVEYLAAGHAALGSLPTQDNIVLERFFDETGGMQLIVHSPYGSRINRAWGLRRGSGSAASSISSYRQPPLRITS